MKTQILIPIVAVMFFCHACKSKDASAMGKTDSSSGKNVSSSSEKQPDAGAYKYDLEHPQKKWELPQELFEISGNTWIDKDHLLVIEDLHPNLYLMKLGDNNATIEKKVPFREETADKKFDVEDVTVVGNTAYALWSHGKIFKVTDWQSNPKVDEIKTFLSKENNTEGICYDPVTKDLLIACKNESDVEDEKKSTRAIYEFDIKGDSLKSEPFMLVHKKDFKKETGEKLEFFPSAIAVHPITHDIYILSTKDTKCMAIFTHGGQMKSFELIDKELLPQPEGICFSPDGVLYISTEGKKGGLGYIYEFTAQK